MIASLNLPRGIKRLEIDKNKVPKKAAKKTQPKKAFFITKSQTLINNQDIRESSFTISAL